MKRSPLVALAWLCWVSAGACIIWAASIEGGLQGGLVATGVVLGISAMVLGLIGVDL